MRCTVIALYEPRCVVFDCIYNSKSLKFKKLVSFEYLEGMYAVESFYFKRRLLVCFIIDYIIQYRSFPLWIIFSILFSNLVRAWYLKCIAMQVIYTLVSGIRCIEYDNKKGYTLIYYIILFTLPHILFHKLYLYFMDKSKQFPGNVSYIGFYFAAVSSEIRWIFRTVMLISLSDLES